METSMKGTVKFFNDVKGFGFITPANGGDPVFVPRSGILGSYAKNQKPLLTGQDVEFEIVKGLKGPKAVQVRALPYSQRDVDAQHRIFARSAR